MWMKLGSDPKKEREEISFYSFEIPPKNPPFAFINNYLFLKHLPIL